MGRYLCHFLARHEGHRDHPKHNFLHIHGYEVWEVPASLGPQAADLTRPAIQMQVVAPPVAPRFSRYSSMTSQTVSCDTSPRRSRRELPLRQCHHKNKTSAGHPGAVQVLKRPQAPHASTGAKTCFLILGTVPSCRRFPMFGVRDMTEMDKTDRTGLRPAFCGEVFSPRHV